MPAPDLARVILAANDAVSLNSLLDDAAVYRPFLQLVISQIVPVRVGVTLTLFWHHGPPP